MQQARAALLHGHVMQVAVAVVDSGIDANHPDLVYAGGKSWVRQPSRSMPGDMTDPGVDFYGHGEHNGWLSVTFNANQLQLHRMVCSCCRRWTHAGAQGTAAQPLAAHHIHTAAASSAAHTQPLLLSNVPSFDDAAAHFCFVDVLTTCPACACCACVALQALTWLASSERATLAGVGDMRGYCSHLSPVFRMLPPALG